MGLSEITTYACYYGYGHLPQLAAYDLAILQAGAYTPEEIAWLEAHQTRTAAYLSVGEIPAAEAQAPWLLHDPATGAPLCNAQWDTVLVDCRTPAWQAHVLTVTIPRLVDRGVTGLFLDTVDVQDHAPETRSGVVTLLHRIRAKYPALSLLVNRGFSILETIAAIADGIVFEAFTTHFDGDGYAVWPDDDLAWTASMAVRIRAAAALPLLALDYAAPADTALRDRAIRRARAHGLLPFVAPRNLDWLP